MLKLLKSLPDLLMSQPAIIILIKVSKSSAQQITLFLSNQLRRNKTESSAAKHGIRLELLHVVESSIRNSVFRLKSAFFNDPRMFQCFLGAEAS